MCFSCLQQLGVGTVVAVGTEIHEMQSGCGAGTHR